LCGKPQGYRIGLLTLFSRFPGHEASALPSGLGWYSWKHSSEMRKSPLTFVILKDLDQGLPSDCTHYDLCRNASADLTDKHLVCRTSPRGAIRSSIGTVPPHSHTGVIEVSPLTKPFPSTMVMSSLGCALAGCLHFVVDKRSLMYHFPCFHNDVSLKTTTTTMTTTEAGSHSGPS
jgi:hypothetical protein